MNAETRRTESRTPKFTLDIQGRPAGLRVLLFKVVRSDAAERDNLPSLSSHPTVSFILDRASINAMPHILPRWKRRKPKLVGRV